MLTFDKTRDVARAVKAKDFERALAARGSEFVEYFEAFTSVASLFDEHTQVPPEFVSLFHLYLN